MELNQINFVSFSVFRNFEKIQDSQEAGLASQLGRNVWKTDWFDGIYLDPTFFHAVSRARSDAWPCPDSDGTGDFAPANSVAKPLCEGHIRSLHRERACILGNPAPAMLSFLYRTSAVWSFQERA